MVHFGTTIFPQMDNYRDRNTDLVYLYIVWNRACTQINAHLGRAFLSKLDSMKSVDIFNYTDFRLYLNDYQKMRQEEDPSFSRSHICRLLGIPQTRSYFNDVVQGKKVTPAYVDRFIEILNLSEEESLYFRLIVNLNQAESAAERKLYFEQLLPFYLVPTRILQKSLHQYYSQWYHGAIRALLEVIEFREDYEYLAGKLFPPISVDEAKSSIALLDELSLIEKDENGIWHVTDKSIVAAPDMSRELLVEYQCNALARAMEALNQSHGMHKQFTTNTISLSQNSYTQLQDRIKKFKSEVRTLINQESEHPDRVYQLNMQLFPIVFQEDE